MKLVQNSVFGLISTRKLSDNDINFIQAVHSNLPDKRIDDVRRVHLASSFSCQQNCGKSELKLFLK